MKVILLASIDGRVGRGDSVHFHQVRKYLEASFPLEVIHRGTYGFCAGRIESGKELRSIGSLMKVITYHVIVIARILFSADAHTVLYCRDWPVGLIAVFVARLRNSTVVYEANGLVIADSQFIVGARLTRALWAGQLLVLKRAAAVIAVTDRLRETIVRLAARSEASTYVVKNTSDAELKEFPAPMPRATLGIGERDTVIGFVGNLSGWQGLPTLVRAFAILVRQYPTCKLLFLGGGPEKQRLTEIVSRLGLVDKVVFVPPVDHAVALRYISLIDIGALPHEHSQRDELVGRSPMKAYEYMACAKPIVSGFFPGISGEIIESGCGILSPPDNPEALAEAFARLVSDPKQMLEMGAAGKRYLLSQRTNQDPGRLIVKICRSTQVANGTHRTNSRVINNHG